MAQMSFSHLRLRLTDETCVKTQEYNPQITPITQNLFWNPFVP
jgi:hypothetical protein